MGTKTHPTRSIIAIMVITINTIVITINTIVITTNTIVIIIAVISTVISPECAGAPNVFHLSSAASRAAA
jgi:hypothetical protein